MEATMMRAWHGGYNERVWHGGYNDEGMAWRLQ